MAMWRVGALMLVVMASAMVLLATPSSATFHPAVSHVSNLAPGWQQLAPAASPPPRAAGAAMAYDPVDNYTVLFGGCVQGSYWYSQCIPSNQTWIFQYGNWSLLTTSVSPPARFYSAMTWDAADGYLLLFGGNSSSGFLNDTWSYLNGSWTQISTSTVPGARAGAAMTYDSAAGAVVLFGGERNRTLISGAGESYSGSDYSDTWLYSHGSWMQIFPTAHPAARDSSAFAMDPVDGYAVLFGGFSWAGINYDETWLFAHGNWSLVGPSGSNSTYAYVPGRNGASMAWDPTLGAVVLFGGHDAFSFYNDTWAFSNGSWQALTGAGPSPRWGASVTYDGAMGCLVLFGGYWDPTAYMGQTWIYYNDTWAFQNLNSTGGGNQSGGGGGNGTGNQSGGSGNGTGNNSGGSGNGTGNNSGGNQSGAPTAPAQPPVQTVPSLGFAGGAASSGPAVGLLLGVALLAALSFMAGALLARRRAGPG